jgi:formylglycine-generating enzyme required for sulfatase activity
MRGKGGTVNGEKAYVASLSKTTGKSYRLLSEAEREYVARAGTTTTYWWGSSMKAEQANYDGDIPNNGGVKGKYRQRTYPVDSFSPNPWGLYQVHGNVWEWVEDCYNPSYAGVPLDGNGREQCSYLRSIMKWLHKYSDPNFLLDGCLGSFGCEPALSWLFFRRLKKLSSCSRILAAARH